METDPQKEQELIEDYLTGQLTGAQLNQFEARLRTDPELQSKVALHDMLDKVLANKAAKVFESKVVEAAQQYFDHEKHAATKTKRLKSTRRVIYLAAASLSLLILATVVLKLQGGSTNYDALYLAYNKHYPVNSAVRSGAANTEGANSNADSTAIIEVHGLWNNALKTYDHQQYAEALALFTNITLDSTHQFYVDLQFFKGLCYMNTQQYPEALTHLNRVIHHPQGSSRRVIAQWFMALTYLKTAQVHEAKALLKTIVNTQESNDTRKAQKLLNALGG